MTHSFRCDAERDEASHVGLELQTFLGQKHTNLEAWQGLTVMSYLMFLLQIAWVASMIRSLACYMLKCLCKTPNPALLLMCSPVCRYGGKEVKTECRCSIGNPVWLFLHDRNLVPCFLELITKVQLEMPLWCRYYIIVSLIHIKYIWHRCPCRGFTCIFTF